MGSRAKRISDMQRATRASDEWKEEIIRISTCKLNRAKIVFSPARKFVCNSILIQFRDLLIQSVIFSAKYKTI